LTGETFKNVAVDFVLALNHLHIKFRKKLQKTNIKNCAHICKIAIEKLYRIDIFYYIKYTVNVLTLAHHQQPEN
jgi:tRNA(Ile)-lysidine synthase TilS/MesJ